MRLLFVSSYRPSKVLRSSAMNTHHHLDFIILMTLPKIEKVKNVLHLVCDKDN